MPSKKRVPLFTPDLVKLCTASFFFQLSFQMVIPVISLYAVDIGASAAVAGLVIGVFSISALCARLPLGRYIDTHRRKGLLVAGAVIQMLGPLLYLVSVEPAALVGARIVHGLGLGSWAVASMTTLVDMVAPQRRGEALGLYGLISLLPQAIGPAIGTPIVEYLSFYHAFAIAAVLGAVPLALVLGVRERFTPRGAAPSRFTDALRNRQLVQASTAIVFLYVANGAMGTFVPIHAVALGMSVTGVGAFFLTWAAGNLVARWMVGRAADRLRPVLIVAPLYAVTSIAIIVLAVGGDIAQFVLAGFAFGIAHGGLVVTLHTLSVSTVQPNLRGTATGIFTSLPEVGLLLGASGLGVMVEAAGFTQTFLLLAVLMPAGALAFWAVERYWPARPAE